MALQIGDTAPDFEAETTEGKIRFHDWIGNNWVVLFSHPKDFTPVCTTELGTMARLKPEFDKRGVKIIGVREQHRPVVADPVVEANFAFRGFGFEIRGGIANLKSHANPPSRRLIVIWADLKFERVFPASMYCWDGTNASLPKGNIPLSQKYYLLGAPAESQKIVWAAH